MTMQRLIRSELRKLITTKMPLAFIAVLIVIAALNAFAVIAGTDMDGSKAFIATEGDQLSLMAFAFNAFMGAGLFGAIAVAREYGHNTIVPTFLASPIRHRAVLAQLAAVAIGGCVLSLIGAALTVAAVAIALPTTDYGFLVSTTNVIRVLAAVQLANNTASWMPANLANVISGTVDDISQPAALGALIVWALVPAVIGLITVQRRDVV